MTAPAILMWAPVSADNSAAKVCAKISQHVKTIKPDIPVYYANQTITDIAQVIEPIIADNVEELVIVPLHLAAAVYPGKTVENLVTEIRQKYPKLYVIASRPIGPEITLLNLLDTKMRIALSNARVLEVDGLVLLATDSGDVRGASLLARRARQWSSHHRLPCVVATADNSGTSLTTAISSLRAQGRRHIAVGSLFLFTDKYWHHQMTQAIKSGAVAISDPIGAEIEIAELVLARYAFGAMELLDFVAQAALADQPNLVLVS